MPFKPNEVLLLSEIIQTAADRGEIVARFGSGGMELSFQLPADLVNEETMMSVVRAFSRRSVSQDW
jgi:hypothetical protein